MLLLRGLQQFLLPLHEEQRITATRLAATGAGNWAPPDSPGLVGARLAAMLVT
ncbi:hypothetical protein Mal64_03950 [Pseudobythopirellula maris]|uniref:Uncharacterized protein n=1 Tax=Pseudobythopirellula maris TaxID=2527991 RepID=A0A5C5ZUV0_9BACT|nr:hypothetical protein [Pseudobythopirellula maris]TWT90013.1 hypothetical protein Mal64_03950 [Pseudobythopirellula maris]